VASIDVGGKSQHEPNRELPLIPLIDFMLCLVSFLLVTAVWSTMARLEASARVPGVEEHPAPPPPRQLHLRMTARTFELARREGSTVVTATSVPRRSLPLGRDGIAYPDLARQLAVEWASHGAHRGAQDPRRDVVVVHTTNTAPFAEVVTVLDAVATPKRTTSAAGAAAEGPAFVASFAVD